MASLSEKLAQAAAGVSTTSVDDGIAVASVEDDVVAVSTGDWTPVTKFKWYNDFEDTYVSTVDIKKNVVLNENQVNVTREELSQFIPFEMPRRYDNFDLALNAASIQFHWVNSVGDESSVAAVNVKYNDTKLRYALLVPAEMTQVAGIVKFEVVITGVNEKNEPYTWRSRINSELRVLECLSGNGMVDPTSSDWYTQFLRDMSAKVVEAQQAVTDAQVAASEAKTARDEAVTAKGDMNTAITNASETIYNDVMTNIAEELAKYHTAEVVDEKIADIQNQIDTMDGLAALDIQYSPETNILTFYNGESIIKDIQLDNTPNADWVLSHNAAMETKIADAVAVVQTELDEYQETVDADLASIHQNIDDLPTTLESDYYNKEAIDTLLDTKADSSLVTRVEKVESTSTSNASDIKTLSGTVADLSEFVNGLNTDPTLSYYATYDASTGEYKLIEVEGEEESIKSQFTIVGGSGGGSSTSTTVTIERVTSSPLTIISGDSAIIEYKFMSVDSSGDDTGEGVAVWKVGSTVVATNVAIQYTETNPYINSFDITKFITTGTQKVTLTITDAAGTISVKNWTVQVVDVSLTSTFNDTFTYTGDVTFSYTPYGAVEKEVHFILDGEEIDSITTTSSGIPMSYVIPEQSHGSHLFETYITATVNGTEIETDHIYKDIMWTDGSNVPIISCIYQTFTARQYDSTNIVYTVYDPSTETPTVIHKLDGEVVSTQTLSDTTNTWQFKSSESGEHVLEIICGETVKTLYVYVEELDIDVTPVTANLVFDFNPVGYSNNDADRLWTNGTVSMTVSDNFDWTNGGYQIDENGDQYFCIKAGTSAVIDYKLFEDDAKKNGKEMKLVFRTTNVQASDAKFLTCVDSTTGTDTIGIEMNVHEAYIYAQAGNLYLPYSENDIIEFEFNINSDSETTARLSGYEDGVSTRHLVYDSSHGFTQVNPQYITLGSDHCDLHIYRFKAYNASLSPSDILNNFIADARNAEDIIDRYNRNQIYDPDKNYTLTPEYLAEKCPWLRVFIVRAPYFTNNKSDKVPGTTIQQIYKNGDPILDNWICYDCMHSGQGTSSNNYGGSGRNQDFIMNKSGIDGVEPYFLLGDGKTKVTEITQTRTSVPVAYLNAKVNIASANNFTNAVLTNRYNEFNPYKRPFVRDEGVDTSFIKDTMEFHNCVIFIQETNEDLSTHREFADTNVHFYAIGNIGDSKKTDKTRLTDMNDPYECCVEIMDVELPLSDFPQDTMMNAMGYEEDPDTKEIIYTWAKDENLGILYELIDGEYILTEDTTVDLTKTYYVDILEHDDFSEDYTYGWRYISDEDDAEIVDYCHQKWIEFYRFVVDSTDEEFKAGLSDYFVVDSALYYYLFTTRYCMIDNRAKNSFWHYGWTGEYDEDGNKIRKWDLSWGYDMDSSMSLNNYGLMAYRYGLEDTDVDETGTEVFRESDSRFFCRIRDLFSNELKSMYNTLESKGAWHAESFLNKIEAWQNEFPEELWRLDIDRKYIRTYTSTFINGEGDAQFLKNMANGKMKYAIKEWERSQEKYMASKYQSSLAANDNAVIRCTTPTGDLVVPTNYKLKLTPFNYMYLNVTYGTASPIQIKAEPNKVYEIPFTGTSTDIIGIYSASCLRSLGDLSPTYPATVDTSKASRINELIIGNSTEGYDNPNFTTLTLGANPLLEKLNLENVSGLTQSLELSLLANLKELYAHGTNTAGVTFADGGLIEIAELPAITAMSMKNLMYLTTLDVVSFNKLTKLVVENCSTVDLLRIFNGAPNLNRVRVLGVDWTLDSTDLLQRIYNMYGVDGNGYNSTQSVLTGAVHVPIIRQQELYEYQTAWPDLEISYDTLIEQFAVTFKNSNGEILEVQYVDKGEDAVDPTTREENPLIPTIPSTVEHDFTFAGWDLSLKGIFSDRTITATYTESLRSYSIKYVSKGTIKQKSTGLYGENIPYTGDIPVYTAEESGYVFYLFNRWDKSGFIDGDKTVNAIFDRFIYTEGAFDGKELADLSPVEIYAMNKLGLAKTVIAEDSPDPYTITLGHDVNYDDIESELLISEKTYFDGTKYIDTGIQLFDEDKDFVLAIDYEFLTGVESGSVLAQCYQANTSHGFKFGYGVDTSQFTWGGTTENVISPDKREMIVIRHQKGNNNLIIYKSNLDGNSVLISELFRTTTTTTTATLIFGATSYQAGTYENYVNANINWAKIWYKDLGEDVCHSLAMWTHESIAMQTCGFNRYFLADGSGQRSSFSLLASHLLSRTKKWNSTNTNDGGWAKSELNEFLNTRLYDAIPTQIKLILKQVDVRSNDGIEVAGTSPIQYYTEITSSSCYVTIPAVVEVSASNEYVSTEPYMSEINALDGTKKTISFLTDDNSRKRAFDGGNYAPYFLRSPYANSSNYSSYSNYVYRVDEDGSVVQVTNPTTNCGILIELSF